MSLVAILSRLYDEKKYSEMLDRMEQHEYKSDCGVVDCEKSLFLFIQFLSVTCLHDWPVAKCIALRFPAEADPCWPQVSQAKLQSAAEDASNGSAGQLLAFLLAVQEEQHRSGNESADEWRLFATKLTDDAILVLRSSLTEALRQVHPVTRLAEAADILLLDHDTAKVHLCAHGWVESEADATLFSLNASERDAVQPSSFGLAEVQAHLAALTSSIEGLLPKPAA